MIAAALVSRAANSDVFTATISVGGKPTTATYVMTSNTDRTVTLGNGYAACVSEYASGDVVVPATVKRGSVSYSVTAVAPWAFARCTGVTSVTIPDGVKVLGHCALAACTSLKRVSLPSTLDSIGAAACIDCDALEVMEVATASSPALASSDIAERDNRDATLSIAPGAASSFADYEKDGELPWLKWFARRTTTGGSLLGDVDGDGCVDIVDLNLLIEHCLGNALGDEASTRADLNGDSNVDALDINTFIILLLN